jgi:hypothetical protein
MHESIVKKSTFIDTLYKRKYNCITKWSYQLNLEDTDADVHEYLLLKRSWNHTVRMI